MRIFIFGLISSWLLCNSALAVNQNYEQFQTPLVGSSPSMENNTETYMVRLPARNLNCQQEAEILRATFLRLNKNPHISVTDARCIVETSFSENGQTYKLYQVSLTYRFQFIGPHFFKANLSINNAADIPGSYGQGAYSSYADCLAAMDKQGSLFYTATGLEPLAVRCEQGWALTPEKSGFILIVESIGEPKAQLFEAHLPDIPRYNTQIKSAAEHLIQRIGGTKVFWSEQNLLYYSSKNLPFRTIQVGPLTYEECESQIGTLQEYLTRMHPYGHYAFCPSQMQGLKNTLLYAILPTADLWIKDDDQNSGNFFTFAECMAVKNAQGSNQDSASFCVSDLLNPDRYIIQTLKKW
ncbi:MAG: hypothetical protein ACXVCP_19505 [Bdellovibrio sp.]